MIEEPVRQNVRVIVRAFAKATGRSISGISKEFYGNADFLDRYFRREHTISVTKLDAMLYGPTGIQARWPKGAPWPICRVVVFRGPQKRVKLSPKNAKAA